MSGLYERLWSGKFTDSQTTTAITREWSIMLEQISDEQIREALKILRDGKTEYVDYPPTCLQFKRLVDQIAIRKEFSGARERVIEPVSFYEASPAHAKLESLADQNDPTWKERAKKAQSGVEKGKIFMEAAGQQLTDSMAAILKKVENRANANV